MKQTTLLPPQAEANPLAIQWGAADALERGPVIATLTNPLHRNVIGVHAGSYSVYRGLAVVTGALDPYHVADLAYTAPTAEIGPYPQWNNPISIVSLDPFGAVTARVYESLLKDGYHIKPTIAVTEQDIYPLELAGAIASGRLKSDGTIVKPNGHARATKIAIEPVWHLPGIAERLDVSETDLRQALYEQMGDSHRELVERPDLKLFLPPIAGTSVLVFGDPRKLADPNNKLTARMHDMCASSDVFGSCKCSCRAYLAYSMELCIRTAQEGGVGLLVYFNKEGRSHGEVTKFLVYNRRDRTGDPPDEYFHSTELVAGVADIRFQKLMPDILHWLGVRRIHELVSASSDKYDAITGSGIEVVERIPILADLIPSGAQTEVGAKEMLAGYLPRHARSH